MIAPDPKRLVDRSVSICVSRGLTVRQAIFLITNITRAVGDDMPDGSTDALAWLEQVRQAARARLLAAPQDARWRQSQPPGGSSQSE